jgi:hypothetical protein
MSQMSDIMGAAFSSMFDMFSSTCEYYRAGASLGTFKTSVKGLRGDELWGAAAQGDRLAVFRYTEIFPVTGEPQRFDRVVLNGQSYTVIDWRQAPAAGAPVWYRLILRGGTQ